MYKNIRTMIFLIAIVSALRCLQSPASAAPPPTAVKMNNFGSGTAVSPNLTGSTATITWTEAGSSTTPPGGSSLSNPKPITFKLGDGQNNSAMNLISGQVLKNIWDVKGTFGGRTTAFIRNSDATKAAHIEADAVRNVAGTALSETTFKVGTFVANPVVVGISAAGAKDDASVSSDITSLARAAGELSWTQGAATVLDVKTLLQATGGASASIVDEGSTAGLTLLAQPGQLALFEVNATNASKPGQSFSFEVTFDGNMLQTPTLNNIWLDLSDFTKISGGWFLPFDEMPGQDLTATLGPGQIAFTSDASGAVVPEPSALVLFGFGILGLLSYCLGVRLGFWFPARFAP